MSREEIIRAKDKSIGHLRGILGDEAETVIAGERYGFISGLLKDILKKPRVEKVTASDKIDQVLVHRIWGIPIFLGAMSEILIDIGSPLHSLSWNSLQLGALRALFSYKARL